MSIRRVGAAVALAAAPAVGLAVGLMAPAPSVGLASDRMAPGAAHRSSLDARRAGVSRPAQARAKQKAKKKAKAPPPPPDLRIVDMEVTPAPALDGGAVTLVMTLHNASTSVAAGTIAIEAVHDRGLPQPLPIHREVVYVGADALVEISFEVPKVAMASSPYTFFVMVDVFDAIEESDESNNTAWLRVAVCGDPEGIEVADGLDNDCDGLADEGLGLSASAGEALEMLREARRRAAFDAAPLAYATPRLPEGFALRRAIRLASEEGPFVIAAEAPPEPAPGGRRGRGQGGRGGGRAPQAQVRAPHAGDLSATGGPEEPAAQLTLTDWNGDDLISGDPVSLQDRDGLFVVAEVMRDGRLVTSAESRQRERLFTIIKIDDESNDISGGDETRSGDRRIRSGDRVALAAPYGRFLHAEGGGGGPLRANRESATGWETFTLTFDDERESR